MYSFWQNRRRWRPLLLELWGGWHGPGFWLSDQQAVVSSSCLARSAWPGSVLDVASLLVALANPLHLLFRRCLQLQQETWTWESWWSALWFLVWSWACWQKQCWALTDDLKLKISAFIAQSYLQPINQAPCLFLLYSLWPRIWNRPLWQDIFLAKTGLLIIINL